MKKNKICIVGQGPTYDSNKFYEDLSDVNVICSTWKGEEDKYENTKSILPNNIIHEVIFNDLPNNSGLRNMNYQTKSTLYGIDLAIERGYDFVFKCRHDMCILNYKKLYEALDLSKFNFLAWNIYGSYPGHFIDYMFGGPTLMMKEFLELSYPNPTGDFPELIYTNVFKEYAKKNDINRVNYFIEDAVKYGIFSTGRHSDGNEDSSKWKSITQYNTDNTKTGKFE